MSNDLERAEQYLTQAWSSAHAIKGDVDENLKSCLIYLSSGLLSLAASQRSVPQQAVIPPRHAIARGGGIRTRSGLVIGFEDLA